MNLSRRQTLKSIAALATIQIVPSRVLGLAGQKPPSEELTRAIIGCGGISASHLGMPGKLLALCDVDQSHLDQRMKDAGGEAKGIKGYRDFREVLERKDIEKIMARYRISMAERAIEQAENVNPGAGARIAAAERLELDPPQ